MAAIGKTIAGSIPHLLLMLALLLYLPWALGVPGTPTADYANGWYLGFYALNIFIAAYAILGVLAVIARFGWLPLPMRWVRTGLWGCASAFIIAMAVALIMVLS
jgi:hypothetical protein